MAKQSGLGDQLYIQSADLSGDTAALDEIGGGNEPLPSTGIDKGGMERLGGQRDGRMNVTSWFNPSVGASHDIYSDLPRTDIQLTYLRGQGYGSPAASLVAKQIGYEGSRGDDGSFTFKVEAKGNAYGLEWGRQLTAGKATFGTAAAGTSIDYGAAVGTTAFGLQAYLHCFAFTGTSATVAIQSSTDDGGGDAYTAVTGATFAAQSAVGVQRIETSRTASVERYLRINVTGTFTVFTFVINVVRNETTVVF